MEKSPTIPIRFKMMQIEPDLERFKPAKPLFIPVKDFIVVIDMPLERQYIYNIENILMKQVSGDSYPDPEFTELGLMYVEDKLLGRTNDKQPENSDDASGIEWEKE